VENYPPSADLKVEAKPVLDPAAVNSDKALNDYDVAVEAWGTRGWQAVGRLCNWAKANGMKVDCPPQP
jgi:hypothetical protein